VPVIESGEISHSSEERASHHLRVDVRQWQRKGVLRPGQNFEVQWSHDKKVYGPIEVHTELDRVVFSYRRWDDFGRGEICDHPVLLEWTLCNYGGRRAWFLCPANGCGRRVGLLYFKGVFLCRKCYGFVYDSQNESPSNRALRRAQSIRMKLGGSTNIVEPFPQKPKGMHWSTYLQLRKEAKQAADQSWPSVQRHLAADP